MGLLDKHHLRGEVVWSSDAVGSPYSDTDTRPWVIISNFKLEDGVLATPLTTTQRDSAIELPQSAWENGGPPKYSYVNPWVCFHHETPEIGEKIGVLNESVSDAVTEELLAYIDGTGADNRQFQRGSVVSVTPEYGPGHAKENFVIVSTDHHPFRDKYLAFRLSDGGSDTDVRLSFTSQKSVKESHISPTDLQPILSDDITHLHATEDEAKLHDAVDSFKQLTR